MFYDFETVLKRLFDTGYPEIVTFYDFSPNVSKNVQIRKFSVLGISVLGSQPGLSNMSNAISVPFPTFCLFISTFQLNHESFSKIFN